MYVARKIRRGSVDGSNQYNLRKSKYTSSRYLTFVLNKLEFHFIEILDFDAFKMLQASE